MAKTVSNSQTLTIRGEEIPVEVRVMKHLDLRYYPENPRIYSLLAVDEQEPSQDEIESRLAEMDHVKQLVQSIRTNGGLIDPLIVKAGDGIVLEGNSRLAAYRLLSRGDPITWAEVKCFLLPQDISEDQVFALLGEYHIIGRKDWAPFEQAGYVWRRHTRHDVSAEQIEKEVGLSAPSIKHLIKVYSFMMEKHELDPHRWSYYDEYLKSKKIAKARKYTENLDDIIVEKIRSGEIAKAADVRDKLPHICDAHKKTFKRFVDGSRPFIDCYEEAVEGGANNVFYKCLYRFRKRITDPDVTIEMRKMPTGLRNKCKYELGKIQKKVQERLKQLG